MKTNSSGTGSTVIDHRARQRQLAERLTADGFGAAVVISRGGGTFDRSADVLYLAGHYQNYPYLPGRPPMWSGRSHTVLVLTAEGQCTLIASTADFDDNLPVDDVRTGGDFVQLVVRAIQDLTAPDDRIAYVGSDVLPDGLARQLRSETPHRTFIDADDLVIELRRRKNPDEYPLIRRAAMVGRNAVTTMLDAVEAGRTESEIVADGVSTAVRCGAGLYYASISSGPHTERFTTASLPGYSRRELEPGDLVRFDLVVVVDGYYSDFGRTTVVGVPDDRQTRLIDTLHAGLDAAIEAVSVGASVEEIVVAGDRSLSARGVRLRLGDTQAPGPLMAAYPPHWGHGLGMGWEPPYLTGDEPATIEEGTYLAVERSITDPVAGTAAAEQNLLITGDGVELLTAGPQGRWS